MLVYFPQSDDEDSGSEISDIDMDTVDPKVLDSMDKALAAAFKTRMQAKSGKKKKLGNRRLAVLIKNPKLMTLFRFERILECAQ